jgi:hypothetical protein
MKSSVAAVLLLAVAPAIAQPAMQKRFDIDCVWKQVDAKPGRPPNTLDGIQQRFRIDTVRKVQCEAECRYLWPIVEVTADRIVLMRSGESGGEASNMEYHADGSFVWDTHYPESSRHITRRGACKAKSFSGFPRDAKDYSQD